MPGIAKENIRNFSIIAHIDHGKSTLADRLLERTGRVAQRDMVAQILDSMDLEKEKGITIKSRAVRLSYTAKNGEDYVLNLIDTPGHVDFTYEVSRSLAACEGALLVVDASQGIEAQTLANAYLAIENDLEVIPVINKVDLPSAEPERVRGEIEDVIGLDASMAPLISAKTGLNIDDVLEAIVNYIPSPEGNDDAPLQALIFDSFYDSYKGAIAYVRIKEGTVQVGDTIIMMSNGHSFEVTEVGFFTPDMSPCDVLRAGDVGYICASIKNVQDTTVGDTITKQSNKAKEPLPGYRAVQPMVFAGFYPADGSNYDALRDALEKLKLNDAALTFEAETSTALGFGFRCGFLGLLHMDIIQERIDREFNLDIVTTSPSVIYKLMMTSGEVVELSNPTNMPDATLIEYMEEPVVEAHIMTPNDFVGGIMELCQDRRGTYIDMEYMEENRVILKYILPLNEIIYDFFDILKSRTRGYASLDYELSGYRRSELVKLDILLNGDIIDAFSMIVHKEKSYAKGRFVAQKLKDVIPQQMFEIPIQAAIGNKVIARETIRALRKDVLAKCYGGDITRKKKLLEKQKEGKKKMRQFGTVEVPSEAFMAVLKFE
ncbi:MAG: elongation factor 4 [Clostridia bacterium]|nr:elongation factor 4 [Clostridia bacterium]